MNFLKQLTEHYMSLNNSSYALAEFQIPEDKLLDTSCWTEVQCLLTIIAQFTDNILRMLNTSLSTLHRQSVA